MIYIDRNLSDGRDYPCIRHDAGEAAVQRLMDQKAIKETVAHAPFSNGEYGACYVIGMEDLDKCKIGFSVQPDVRLRQIQTGLWGKGVCHALFWCLKVDAQILEFNALRSAKASGRRLKGEWVDLTPTEATQLVFNAGPMRFTDSAMFLDRWISASFQTPTFRNQGIVGSVENIRAWEQSKGIY